MAGYCSKAQQHQSVAGDQRHLPFQPIAYKEMLCRTVAEERDDLGPEHTYSCFVQPIPPVSAGVGLGTGHSFAAQDTTRVFVLFSFSSYRPHPLGAAGDPGKFIYSCLCSNF